MDVMTEKQTDSCLVCQRIPPKIVFYYAHRIFGKTILTRDVIHRLALEACTAINYADAKTHLFFCGRTQLGILSGLFYLLTKKFGYRLSMAEIADSLPSAHTKQKWRIPPSDHNHGTLSYMAIAQSYQHWLRYFPELFAGLDCWWVCKCGTWNKLEDLCCSKCHDLADWRVLKS